MNTLPSFIAKCLATIWFAFVFGCSSFNKNVELPKEQPLSVEVKGVMELIKENNIDPGIEHKVFFRLACIDEKMCDRATQAARTVGFDADWYGSPAIEYINVNLSLRMKPQKDQLEQAILKARKVAHSVGAVQFGFYVESLPGEGATP